MSTSKDYYEILGVRPTAKPAEIDLAFKGRRTQYHPDKYASADTDTLRWATEKMQEVNEAYTALSHPDARSRYDQGRQSAHRDPHPAAGTHRSGRTEENEDATPDIPFILDYLTALPLDQEDAKRFHFAPNIPRRRLSNALACRHSYATKPPGQAYLLVDDTVFEGGADGLLITDEVISFKGMFVDSNDYRYSYGWNGTFSVEGSTVKLDNQICKIFSLISTPALQMLVWALNQIFADRFEWHTQMALRGHVESQFILSNSCRGIPGEGLRWLTLAAENGHMVAQHNLGVHYLHKNLQLAFQWFAKAAQQGSIHSQRELRSDIYKQFY